MLKLSEFLIVTDGGKYALLMEKEIPSNMLVPLSKEKGKINTVTLTREQEHISTSYLRRVPRAYKKFGLNLEEHKLLHTEPLIFKGLH